jgi:hypothetical protein
MVKQCCRTRPSTPTKRHPHRPHIAAGHKQPVPRSVQQANPSRGCSPQSYLLWAAASALLQLLLGAVAATVGCASAAAGLLGSWAACLVPLLGSAAALTVLPAAAGAAAISWPLAAALFWRGATGLRTAAACASCGSSMAARATTATPSTADAASPSCCEREAVRQLFEAARPPGAAVQLASAGTAQQLGMPRIGCHHAQQQPSPSSRSSNKPDGPDATPVMGRYGMQALRQHWGGSPSTMAPASIGSAGTGDTTANSISMGSHAHTGSHANTGIKDDEVRQHWRGTPLAAAVDSLDVNCTATEPQLLCPCSSTSVSRPRTGRDDTAGRLGQPGGKPVTHWHEGVAAQPPPFVATSQLAPAVPSCSLRMWLAGPGPGPGVTVGGLEGAAQAPQASPLSWSTRFCHTPAPRHHLPRTDQGSGSGSGPAILCMRSLQVISDRVCRGRAATEAGAVARLAVAAADEWGDRDDLPLCLPSPPLALSPRNSERLLGAPLDRLAALGRAWDLRDRDALAATRRDARAWRTGAAAAAAAAATGMAATTTTTTTAATAAAGLHSAPASRQVSHCQLPLPVPRDIADEAARSPSNSEDAGNDMNLVFDPDPSTGGAHGLAVQWGGDATVPAAPDRVTVTTGKANHGRSPVGHGHPRDASRCTARPCIVHAGARRVASSSQLPHLLSPPPAASSRTSCRRLPQPAPTPLVAASHSQLPHRMTPPCRDGRQRAGVLGGLAAGDAAFAASHRARRQAVGPQDASHIPAAP